MEFVCTLPWFVFFKIILIDVLFAADNVCMIALSCRNLSEKYRYRGMISGVLAAIILRMAMVLLARILLKIFILKIICGLLLFSVAIKFSKQDIKNHKDININVINHSNIFDVIKQIILVDFFLSLDNVAAISSITQNINQPYILSFIFLGLLVSMPTILFCSQMMLNCFDRFPFIVKGAAGLLGWLATDLIISDPLWANLNFCTIGVPHWIIKMLGMLFVVLIE